MTRHVQGGDEGAATRRHLAVSSALWCNAQLRVAERGSAEAACLRFGVSLLCRCTRPRYVRANKGRRVAVLSMNVH